MKIYRLNNEDGRAIGFEIDNVCISKRKIAALLKNIEGVSGIRVRKLFSADDEIHIAFKYHGKDFIVWEPWGDNSRYWIGPKNDTDIVNLSVLEKAFENYQPSFFTNLLGSIISLNFTQEKNG